MQSEGPEYQDLHLVRNTYKSGEYHLKGSRNHEIFAESKLGTLKARISRENYKIKACICITMYGEEFSELIKTMTGIIKYVGEQQNNDSAVTADEILVFLVCDGFDHVKPEFKEKLKELSLYDENKINEEDLCRKEGKLSVNQNKYESNPSEEAVLNNCVHCFFKQIHRFEKIPEWEKAHLENTTPFVNFFLCMKHFNGGKLDSHFWFMRGFCNLIKPQFIFMIDIGTEPTAKSISILQHRMEQHIDIGGCCGNYF